jgi:hypothetical protein
LLAQLFPQGAPQVEEIARELQSEAHDGESLAEEYRRFVAILRKHLVGAPAQPGPSFATKENTLKPSIGRIVIYNHPGSSDGKYPPQKSPAIIQNVAEDGSVRLFVFGPKGQHMDEGLIQGDGPCQWNWPERV